ncbi:MAG TPA: hypothetical protein VMD08_14745 [Candidatus Baltobacteraceae bacterium]|nr:hypothetical protein [Candidatus Baltobacteraceae bacterium]
MGSTTHAQLAKPPAVPAAPLTAIANLLAVRRNGAAAGSLAVQIAAALLRDGRVGGYARTPTVPLPF